MTDFYGVPHVSWRDAVWPQYAQGRGIFDRSEAARLELWVEAHPEAIHFGAWGHEVATALLARLVADEAAAVQADPTRPRHAPQARRRGAFGGAVADAVTRPADELDATVTYLYTSGAMDMWMRYMMQLGWKAYRPPAPFPGLSRAQLSRMLGFKEVARGPGWALTADRPTKIGWIADGKEQSGEVVFEVPVTAAGGYTVLIGYLRSYEGMAQFDATCRSEEPCTTVAGDVPAPGRPHRLLDGLWTFRASVYHDNLVCTCWSPSNITIRRRLPPTPAAVGEKRGSGKVMLLAVSAMLAPRQRPPPPPRGGR